MLKHTAQSVKSLLSRFTYYGAGYCLVHHMFGEEVVRKVKKLYIQGTPEDAMCAAHLEVPGTGKLFPTVTL